MQFPKYMGIKIANSEISLLTQDFPSLRLPTQRTRTIRFQKFTIQFRPFCFSSRIPKRQSQNLQNYQIASKNRLKDNLKKGKAIPVTGRGDP
jgi:hypothetical protein